jgi:hypothetical protein
MAKHQTLIFRSMIPYELLQAQGRLRTEDEHSWLTVRNSQLLILIGARADAALQEVSK